jgi:hypothetical protein
MYPDDVESGKVCGDCILEQQELEAERDEQNEEDTEIE